MGRHDEIEAAARALVDALSDTRYHGIDIGTLGDPMRALRAALALPREGAEPSAEAVREACAALVRPERFGTRECSCDSIAEDVVDAIRALPLPAPSRVEEARRAFYEAARAAVRLARAVSDAFDAEVRTGRDHGEADLGARANAASDEKEAAYDALLAAERAAKGGERG